MKRRGKKNGPLEPRTQRTRTRDARHVSSSNRVTHRSHLDSVHEDLGPLLLELPILLALGVESFPDGKGLTTGPNLREERRGEERRGSRKVRTNGQVSLKDRPKP